MAVVLDTTAVSDEELLEKVKELNDYGQIDLDDPKLKILIDDAKDYLRMSGVAEVIVNSKAAVNVIAYYIDDITRKEGISEYVINRVSQFKVVSHRYERV